MKLKVITVIGTRPEIIRLSRVMHALDFSESIEHVVVHTGQNYDYELNQIFFDELELRKPNYFLDAAGETTADTIGQIFTKLDKILDVEKPDAFLVLGDTNSCLSTIIAKKKHIPVFHMEAGNRCFDQRVPEETNRKIVDHISDINLTYSNIAREYLINEGFPAKQIIKTGSPMFEVINYYLPGILSSNILEKLKIEKGKFFVVSFHRQENVDDEQNLSSFLEILNLVSEKYNYPIIVSTHPRTRAKIEKSNIKIDSNIHFLKPLGFFDYQALQINSFAVLSDSGTISEESSILNFRALNLRESHERPEGMEEAAAMMVGLNADRVMQGLSQLQYQKTDSERNFRLVSDYSVPNVSDKVVRIIISYVDYIKRLYN